EKLHIEEFSIAEETIRSPVTVIDKESTERKKKEAEEQVNDVYVLKKEIGENRVDFIASIFDAAMEVIREADLKSGEENNEDTAEKTPVPDEEKVEMLKDKLPEDVKKEISD